MGAIARDRSMLYCLLVMGLLIVLAEIACSGSGRGAGGAGGASGDGGMPATGGKSSADSALGAGGAGGAGGADARTTDGASDGAGGAGGVGGAGGTGGGLTADEVCRAALGALCDRYAACAGSPPVDPSTLSPPCNDTAAACPDYFFNGTSTRTLASVAGCLGELEGLSCTDIDLGVRPSCFTPGTAPNGTPCARASTCQSGTCSGYSLGCGSCIGTLAATGASCADGSGCGPGDFCHPATKLCTPASTIVHAGAGETCDPAAVPSIGCAGDRYCRTVVDGGTAGTCEPRQPPIVLDAGQACDAVNVVCPASFVCFINMNLPTADGSYVTVSSCVPMYSCGSTACDETTYCETSGGRQSCVPKAAAGESCLGDGGDTPCANGLYCASTTGVCTPYGKPGDACDDRHPCDDHLLCVSGQCAQLSTSACALLSKDGGAG